MRINPLTGGILHKQNSKRKTLMEIISDKRIFSLVNFDHKFGEPIIKFTLVSNIKNLGIVSLK